MDGRKGRTGLLIFCLIGAVVLVLVDYWIKLWAVEALKPVGSIPLIQDVLHLTYLENDGRFVFYPQRTEMVFDRDHICGIGGNFFILGYTPAKEQAACYQSQHDPGRRGGKSHRPDCPRICGGLY